MRTEGPAQDEENLVIESLNVREFVFDASSKKKNTFWCSSTFCIPCTKSVKEQSNIIKRAPQQAKMQINESTDEEFKNDNNGRRTTMNDKKIVEKKVRTVTSEDKDNSLKEEYKIIKDDSRNNLAKKGNDKIHILMNDFEEDEDDDRFRKLSNSRSFNRSVNQSNEDNKRKKQTANLK